MQRQRDGELVPIAGVLPEASRHRSWQRETPTYCPRRSNAESSLRGQKPPPLSAICEEMKLLPRASS